MDSFIYYYPIFQLGDGADGGNQGKAAGPCRPGNAVDGGAQGCGEWFGAARAEGGGCQSGGSGGGGRGKLKNWNFWNQK